MQQQPSYIVVEGKVRGLPRLLRRRFRRNKNVAKIPVFSRKRQHIGRFVDSPVTEIVVAHGLVRDENHTEYRLLRILAAHCLHEIFEKISDSSGVDGMLPLPIQELIALIRSHRPVWDQS